MEIKLGDYVFTDMDKVKMLCSIENIYMNGDSYPYEIYPVNNYPAKCFLYRKLDELTPATMEEVMVYLLEN
jgi:hypothetical protein